MALIVQKYGGTSVRDVEHIRRVAKRVIATRQKGNDVVVVVSAMAGETDRLVRLAHEISRDPDVREYDQLISTGEQVTVALLALSLQEAGQAALSFLGHQVKIVTDSQFSRARIQSIDAKIIFDSLKQGKVVVVAGFQGMDEGGNITTLGRGGSDTTAVALATVLKAALCEIYTDVDGVYTADPNICPEAKKLDRISYEEMLEMSSQGAKVLQIRSVEFAAKYGVRVEVRSSIHDRDGTIICKEDKPMEEVIVSGVTLEEKEAKLALRHVPDKPGVAMQVFTPVADAGINVDMIVQNVSEDGFTDLTFTVPSADLSRAKKIVEKVCLEIECPRVDADEDIAKVSVIGVGMRSHAGVAAKVFKVLSQSGINVEMISTSEIRISVVVKRKRGREAVRALHEAFGMGK